MAVLVGLTQVYMKGELDLTADLQKEPFWK